MKKILVVDNHPLVCRRMEARLQNLGYTVQTAGDGLAALEILDNFVPDIALIDLVMPNIDGEQLCRIIRSRPALAAMHLIIISSIAAEEQFDPATCGADACIAKSAFERVAANLALVLDDLATHGRILAEHRILGTEDLFKREVTGELLSARRHHRLVLENISDGIVELNPAGRIIYANPRALDILQRREEDLLGSRFGASLEPPAAETLANIIANPAVRPLNFAAPLHLLNRQVRLAVHPLVENSHPSFVILLHDITEAKATDATLRRTANELRQSLADLKSAQEIMIRQEKLASIGTLASGVAHEILNPLNIIGTIVQLLQMEEELPADMGERLAEVMKQVRRATKITNGLRQFSHRSQREVRAVDIHALLDENLYLLGHDLELDNVVVERDYAPGLPTVIADPDQLAQVFLNLVNNARDAMKNSKQRRLMLRTGQVEQGVGLTVSDSGCGIAAEDLNKIFDPFFTTKEPGSGTGMGLAITHGIIENLGGSIEVESRPGEGTVFFLVLPLSQPTAASTGKEEPNGQPKKENSDRR